MAAPRARFKDDDSGTHAGRETQHLAKVVVEGDQRAVFSNRYVKHLFVRRPLQPLIANCHHIVSGAPKQLGDAAAQILVELEPYAIVAGTKRTRAASAPKAIAARTSS